MERQIMDYTPSGWAIEAEEEEEEEDFTDMYNAEIRDRMSLAPLYARVSMKRAIVGHPRLSRFLGPERCAAGR